MQNALPCGLYPMLYAFFEENGNLRTDPFLQQVDAALATSAAGVAILGLATEVSKLTVQERADTVRSVAERIDGRKPLLVTVYGNTPQQQILFAKRAIDYGASALILQPPAEPLSDAQLRAFFSTVMESISCPAGIQNAPEFLGFGLSNESLISLAQEHDNFAIAKLECTAVALEPVATRLSGKVQVFNGRCALELTDNLRAGANGIIPGFETVDKTSDIFAAYRSTQPETADQLYKALLPVQCFLMQGIPHLLTYGKMLAALRLGIEHSGSREPALAATTFGSQCVKRFFNQLGTFESST